MVHEEIKILTEMVKEQRNQEGVTWGQIQVTIDTLEYLLSLEQEFQQLRERNEQLVTQVTQLMQENDTLIQDKTS